ncbi:hypothetical protein PR048_022993 [Dryococelus australis]|uniref:Uncharacterized protein n=1 Tax=Dryococelus australis TaxID=614101 RepID=A0ABQ9GST1_9NEOP|nr:hypothetical protein PR048_022993 [Dryococelus australis]
MDHRLNPVEDLRRMEEEPEEFWLQLMRTYLVDAPRVTVRGRPSMKEQLDMTENERRRVGQQRQRLGEQGLRTQAELLQQAMNQNEVSAISSG